MNLQNLNRQYIAYSLDPSNMVEVLKCSVNNPPMCQLKIMTQML